MATLLTDSDLDRSTVVANSTMNRERSLTGVNSYRRELGFDPAEWLLGRPGPASWLDLCSGEGLALLLAADRLLADAVLTGVDLVGPVGHRTSAAGVRLVTASLADWSPGRKYDLITCVHGLHYLGDKLGLLAKIADWLVPDGRFTAHFDPESVRRPDGGSLARPVLAALRAAGFEYRARRHLLTLDGGRTVRLPFDYLGADDTAGPNYTGQPGVASHYRT
ncbi:MULTISPECIES: trans-aconitate 2-methyltransferase [unclassified Kitasatospora]|uniref:class I SAM-dependent methyltransferase n=1 Tax=unclassified Kitasatospora TaxID=2633591 RepID=UPI000B2CE7A5|nr:MULTISPECIES: methyltransferase domain-containing protein [unclassified Kitasatospora]